MNTPESTEQESRLKRKPRVAEGGYLTLTSGGWMPSTTPLPDIFRQARPCQMPSKRCADNQEGPARETVLGNDLANKGATEFLLWKQSMDTDHLLHLKMYAAHCVYFPESCTSANSKSFRLSACVCPPIPRYISPPLRPRWWHHRQHW